MKNLKVQLKLLTSRLGLVIQKKQAISRQQTAEIAQLLDQGKDASARIKVELVIREDYYVEGLQLIALQAELLLARFGLLDLNGLDEGIQEPVMALLYAAPRVDVKELGVIAKQLAAKMGKDFAQACFENHNDCINQKLVRNLSTCSIDPNLISAYLTKIAEAYKVDWKDATLDNPFINRVDNAIIEPVLEQNPIAKDPRESRESASGTYVARPSDSVLMPNLDE